MTRDEMIKSLADIRDELVREQATSVSEPVRNEKAAEEARRETASLVLYSLLVNLDGWIDGQHSNHEGSGHRGENRGEECWRLWAPSDIRNMINDVAREFGVGEFPRPAAPKEDEYR